MEHRIKFWQQLTARPLSTSKRHIGITVSLLLVVSLLYYIGDGFLSGSADGFPSFLYGQAYHELVLLLFSGVVIYVAVALRSIGALSVSLTGFLIMLPHTLFIPTYPDPMYRILSWLAINILLSLFISGVLNAREQQQTYLRDITNAQEQERHRLSRELHDETAQGLIDAAHAIDEIMESPHLSENIVTSLHSLRHDVDETLERTRRAIQGLQPPLLDEIGIRPALLWLCENILGESGIEIDSDIDLFEEQLTQEVKIALFRVTQEVLANIKRHSQANRVELKLKANGNRVTLTISDNGVGFQPISRGRLHSEGKAGLVGIQERVSLVRGSFNLYSKIGEGTRVTVEIPLVST